MLSYKSKDKIKDDVKRSKIDLLIFRLYIVLFYVKKILKSKNIFAVNKLIKYAEENIG